MAKLELKVTEEVIMEKANAIEVREDLTEIAELMITYRRQQQQENEIQLVRMFVKVIASKIMKEMKERPYADVYTARYGTGDAANVEVVNMLTYHKSVAEDICAELQKHLKVRLVRIIIEQCAIVQIGF